jgi:tetratricopeptide (TPR) repeat protein
MQNPAAPAPHPKIAEALAFLQAAEQSAATGDPARLAWTIQQFDEGIARLTPFAMAGGDPRRWLALAWCGRGNAQRARGAAGFAEARRSYDEAVKIFETTAASGAADDARRHDLANVWMNRGLALLAAGAPEHIVEALANFDHAIAQRRELPAGPNHEYRFGLAASWLHRADALIRLGTPEHWREALAAYDEALAAMRTLPIEENDWFRHRLAITWMNRGIAGQTALGAEGATEVLRDFDACIGLLKNHRVCERPEGKHLLACAWLNRAGVLLATAAQTADDARAAALVARDTTAALAEQQPGFAEVALKARHALVRVALLKLAEVKTADDRREIMSEATDAVDEGLALTRAWAQRGVAAFQPIEAELFRLGAQLYLQHQPQFLAEFVLENLDRTGGAPPANRAMIQIGREVVAHALQSLRSRGFGELGQAGMERTLEILGDLRAAEKKLHALNA